MGIKRGLFLILTGGGGISDKLLKDQSMSPVKEKQSMKDCQLKNNRTRVKNARLQNLDAFSSWEGPPVVIVQQAPTIQAVITHLDRVRYIRIPLTFLCMCLGFYDFTHAHTVRQAKPITPVPPSHSPRIPLQLAKDRGRAHLKPVYLAFNAVCDERASLRH